MLSLANAFSSENMFDFTKRIKNFLNLKNSEKIVFSPDQNTDGISVNFSENLTLILMKILKVDH